MAKASEEAISSLSLGKSVPLSCHKQTDSGSKSRHKLDLPRHKADCTVDHNCSSLHPELWRDRGATAHVPCQALCVDANGKTCLASPSAGAECGDLIDAVAVEVLLCSDSRSHSLALTTALSLSPAGCLAGVQQPLPKALISTHKPHGCPTATEREGQQRVSLRDKTLPARPHAIIQSKVSATQTSSVRYVRGARYRCFRRHVNPAARPPSPLVTRSHSLPHPPCTPLQ